MRRALGVLALGLTLVASGGAATPTVREAQVNPLLESPFPQNKQNEPSLAQNPRNPLNLISSSNDESGEPPCPAGVSPACQFQPGVSVSGYYASFDGGQTWTCHGLLDFSAQGFYGFGDPGQAFDTRGNAFYSTLAKPLQAPGGAEVADVFVARSSDGGCTYPQAVKVSSGGGFHDKPANAVDTRAKSRFKDNVYVAWTWQPPVGADRILFVRSRDHGVTWSAPATISATSDASREGSTVAVGPDGTVYVAWLDDSTERLSISHDGGRTFAVRGLTIAGVTNTLHSPLPGASFRQERDFPVLAVDQKGIVYAVWATGSAADGAVVLTASTDGGKHWSKVRAIAKVPGRNPFFSTVTVDPKGAIDIAFSAADEVSGAAGAGVIHYDTYFARSTDKARTFSAPLKLSSVSSDPDGASANALTAQFLGDYISIVGDSRGHGAFVVWTDSRNAASCPAVDAFRAAPGSNQPDVLTACPPTFGNTDIFLGAVSY